MSADYGFSRLEPFGRGRKMGEIGLVQTQLHVNYKTAESLPLHRFVLKTLPLKSKNLKKAERN